MTDSILQKIISLLIVGIIIHDAVYIGGSLDSWYLGMCTYVLLVPTILLGKRFYATEVAGIIDKAGKDVTRWETGQRVAVGWHEGHYGHCVSCRRGDFATCRYAQVPGISYDGGFADYMIAPIEILALIPEQLSAVEAAPLMWGYSLVERLALTFHIIRHS